MQRYFYDKKRKLHLTIACSRPATCAADAERSAEITTLTEVRQWRIYDS